MGRRKVCNRLTKIDYNKVALFVDKHCTSRGYSDEWAAQQINVLRLTSKPVTHYSCQTARLNRVGHQLQVGRPKKKVMPKTPPSLGDIMKKHPRKGRPSKASRVLSELAASLLAQQGIIYRLRQLV